MRNLEKYVLCCMGELDAIGIKYGNILEVKVNTRAKKRLGQTRETSNVTSVVKLFLEWERMNLYNIQNIIGADVVGVN